MVDKFDGADHTVVIKGVGDLHCACVTNMTRVINAHNSSDTLPDVCIKAKIPASQPGDTVSLKSIFMDSSETNRDVDVTYYDEADKSIKTRHLADCEVRQYKKTKHEDGQETFWLETIILRPATFSEKDL